MHTAVPRIPILYAAQVYYEKFILQCHEYPFCTRPKYIMRNAYFSAPDTHFVCGPTTVYRIHHTVSEAVTNFLTIKVNFMRDATWSMNRISLFVFICGSAYPWIHFLSGFNIPVLKTSWAL